MKKLYVAAIIVVAMAVACGGWIAARHFRNERSEKIHFEQQETELVITNLAKASLHLFKAGKSLQDAVEIKYFDGSRPRECGCHAAITF